MSSLFAIISHIILFILGLVGIIFAYIALLCIWLLGLALVYGLPLAILGYILSLIFPSFDVNNYIIISLVIIAVFNFI